MQPLQHGNTARPESSKLSAGSYDITTFVYASMMCGKTKDLEIIEVFRFGNSKAEGVLFGVTNSGPQPFPRQNQGEETIALTPITRSNKSPER